jgi:hypothetical protein
MSQTPQPHEALEPPAMGERRARWGFGYQDKVATDRILRILRDDLSIERFSYQLLGIVDFAQGWFKDFPRLRYRTRRTRQRLID